MIWSRMLPSSDIFRMSISINQQISIWSLHITNPNLFDILLIYYANFTIHLWMIMMFSICIVVSYITLLSVCNVVTKSCVWNRSLFISLLNGINNLRNCRRPDLTFLNCIIYVRLELLEFRVYHPTAVLLNVSVADLANELKGL